MSFLEISRFFKKIDVNPNYIIFHDSFFYNKMLKLFKDSNIDYDTLKKIPFYLNQIGGNYKVSIDKDEFIEFKEFKNDGNLFFVFNGKKIINKKSKIIETRDDINSQCILFTKENNKMHISQINVFGNYCLTNKNKILNGSTLLNITIEFIKSMKDIYKIKYITLHLFH